jgi:cytochrome P450
VIAIPLNAMQREKKVWGADADVFRPERWLEYELERTVNEKDKQHPHEHVRRELMAFSAGFVLFRPFIQSFSLSNAI